MPADLARAARAATDLLQVLGVNTLPVDPRSLCNRLGISISGLELDGLDGCLLRVGTASRIVVNSRIPYEGRTAFTIGHELGHWNLHPGLDQSWLCTASDLADYSRSPVEVEANCFAANLLMPTTLLRASLKFAAGTFQEVCKLADACQTTLTASAIRLVDLIDEPLLLVASRQNRVTWFRQSSKARSRFLRQDGTVPEESAAWNCVTTLPEIGDPIEVDAEVWFKDDYGRERLEVYEQSVLLPEYDVTLTLLTAYEE